MRLPGDAASFRVAGGGERRQLLFEASLISAFFTVSMEDLSTGTFVVRSERALATRRSAFLPDASDVRGEPLDFGAGVLSTNTVGFIEPGGESL